MTSGDCIRRRWRWRRQLCYERLTGQLRRWRRWWRYASRTVCLRYSSYAPHGQVIRPGRRGRWYYFPTVRQSCSTYAPYRQVVRPGGGGGGIISPLAKACSCGDVMVRFGFLFFLFLYCSLLSCLFFCFCFFLPSRRLPSFYTVVFRMYLCFYFH